LIELRAEFDYQRHQRNVDNGWLERRTQGTVSQKTTMIWTTNWNGYY